MWKEHSASKYGVYQPTKVLYLQPFASISHSLPSAFRIIVSVLFWGAINASSQKLHLWPENGSSAGAVVGRCFFVRSTFLLLKFCAQLMMPGAMPGFLNILSSHLKKSFSSCRRAPTVSKCSECLYFLADLCTD